MYIGESGRTPLFQVAVLGAAPWPGQRLQPLPLCGGAPNIQGQTLGTLPPGRRSGLQPLWGTELRPILTDVWCPPLLGGSSSATTYSPPR